MYNLDLKVGPSDRLGASQSVGVWGSLAEHCKQSPSETRHLGGQSISGRKAKSHHRASAIAYQQPLVTFTTPRPKAIIGRQLGVTYPYWAHAPSGLLGPCSTGPACHTMRTMAHLRMHGEGCSRVRPADWPMFAAHAHQRVRPITWPRSALSLSPHPNFDRPIIPLHWRSVNQLVTMTSTIRP